MPPVASAQDVTEAALKAAFIYKIVLFTEWPTPLSGSDPFVICVAGDPAVAETLERVVKGRELTGHRITVSLVDTAGPKDACRVLYVSGVTTGQLASHVAKLQDSPILTISDVVGFTQAGGMAQFFFVRGQLRFSIRLDVVNRSGLRMSSKLLDFAKRYEGS